MDNLTKSQRRKNMQNIRSKGTLPERQIATFFRKNHIHCSRNVKSLFGKPDFVFRRKKAIIFIDSDFWHGNPKNFKLPKSNIFYWKKKIEQNIIRDKTVTRTLKKEGWKILRIWESDLKKNHERTERKILRFIMKTVHVSL